MENNLKGNENCFELAGGSSYRGFEIPEVDCSTANTKGGTVDQIEEDRNGLQLWFLKT